MDILKRVCSYFRVSGTSDNEILLLNSLLSVCSIFFVECMISSIRCGGSTFTSGRGNVFGRSEYGSLGADNSDGVGVVSRMNCLPAGMGIRLGLRCRPANGPSWNKIYTITDTMNRITSPDILDKTSFWWRVEFIYPRVDLDRCFKSCF